MSKWRCQAGMELRRGLWGWGGGFGIHQGHQHWRCGKRPPFQTKGRDRSTRKKVGVTGRSGKHEALSWIHRTNVKRLDVVAYACHLGTREAETGRCLGLPGQSALGDCQVNERSCLKNKLKQNKWMAPSNQSRLPMSSRPMRETKRKCQDLREGFSQDESPEAHPSLTPPEPTVWP